MRITPNQEELLNSFCCQRLTSDPTNAGIIQGFYSKKGNNITRYLIEDAWKEDLCGSNAVYLVKDPEGLPCAFFALKCAMLFTPLDEDELTERTKQAKRILDLLFDVDNVTPERKGLISALEAIREQNNSTVEEVLNNIISAAWDTKSYGQNILEQLKVERSREGDRPIQRVQSAFPGVEITHFCVNDAFRNKWKQYGIRFSPGEVIFWKFIVPKFEELRKLVGCQFALLFAADTTVDGNLTNYYHVTLKFKKLIDVGTIKPRYDWCCEFMSQEVSEMILRKEEFFENFNIDDDIPIV